VGVLVLVGDVDQLPSVGAGAVLADVIASGRRAGGAATEIFRQAGRAASSGGAPRQPGGVPVCPPAAAATSTSSRAATPEAIWQKIVTMVRRALPGAVRLRPAARRAVMTPMNRSELAR